MPGKQSGSFFGSKIDPAINKCSTARFRVLGVWLRVRVDLD